MNNGIHNVNVKTISPIVSPRLLKEKIPTNEKSRKTVVSARDVIKKILNKKDDRLLAIVGPCSAHDEVAAFEYATMLDSLSHRVKETLYIVMRVYFEKPRTTIGWKGMINDPNIDESCNVENGIKEARKLLLKITEMGMPVATEFLDPIIPQYIADLVSWVAIGARTTESQTHREMSSGLSMPVGYKNGTDGNLEIAINAMIAAKSPQSFLGINQDGRVSIVRTNGNPAGHLILRGGKSPNYDAESVKNAIAQLDKKGLPQVIMVDCSHGNSEKKFQNQEKVWKNIIQQRLSGNDAIIGLMLESNIFEGNQKSEGTLKYGVSITDECVGFQKTEELLLWADSIFRKEVESK